MRVYTDLPLGVTWVVPPKTALGVALMDESGGRYKGNEIEEEALHYYHGAPGITNGEEAIKHHEARLRGSPARPPRWPSESKLSI